MTNKYLTLEDAIKRINKLEDKVKINYIKQIKKFGNKYSDEELEKVDLESLETIMDACSRFVYSDENPEIIPITPPTKPKQRPTGEVFEKVDFGAVFDNVAKDFNMSNIESER